MDHPGCMQLLLGFVVGFGMVLLLMNHSCVILKTQLKYWWKKKKKFFNIVLLIICIFNLINVELNVVVMLVMNFKI
jgi:hypothetical protein